MPKKRTEAKEAYVEVSSTVLGHTKKKVQKIRVKPFVTDTATVSVKNGMTIPTGDYQSARVDVMIAVPCYVEEIPTMFKKVEKLVDKLISKRIDGITGEMDGKEED